MSNAYSNKFAKLPVTDTEDDMAEMPLQQMDRHAGILESESPQINSLTTPDYTPFSVVLDSGAADHVVSATETPGYAIRESPGSKAGSCFIAANGERIPNQGQVRLQMKAGEVPVHSTFQVSKISKPLWSVGKLCDAGYKVEFNRNEATVTHQASGKKIGTFTRHQGLYVGAMMLKNPSSKDFQGQA